MKHEDINFVRTIDIYGKDKSTDSVIPRTAKYSADSEVSFRG